MRRLVLAAWLVAGPASAVDYKWDIPDILADVEVPGLMQAEGIPVKLHAVVSKLNYNDLATHFVASFRKQGLYVEQPWRQVQVTREPRITGFDPDKLISYTVILQPNKDGTTTVVMGEANLGHAKRPTGADFVPIYPGSKDVLRTDVEVMRSLSYTTPDAPARVEAFYKDQLPRAGYKEAEPSIWRRGAEEVTVRINAKDGKTSIWAGHRMATEPEPVGPSP